MTCRIWSVLFGVARNDTDHAYEQWFDLDTLDAAHLSEQPQAAYREFLNRAQQILAEKFTVGTNVVELIHARSWVVDQVLTRCWKPALGGFHGALVAVGGYGRRELMPGSDVDIMLLLAETEDSQTGARLEAFLTLLWDIGLEVGHSVRTLQECHDQARDDITVATNLMEARLIYGPKTLFQEMCERIGPDQIWPSPAFFEAKLKEQRNRYARFDDAVYNLEPNVKEGPGGLRDGWHGSVRAGHR